MEQTAASSGASSVQDGTGRKPGKSGHFDYLHSVLFSGRILSWKKGGKPEISLGNGAGDRICSASHRGHIFDGAPDNR